MGSDITQISALISTTVKAKMERYVRSVGVTRARLIEQALEHHLQALDELPQEWIVPARVVLSAESAEKVREWTSHPSVPTPAMQQLFDED